MSKWLEALCALVLAVIAMPVDAQRYGLGRAPAPHEIAAWDIDVRPDGHGVKAGKGTVAQGQKIYDAQCASCHGTFGESNRYMPIAGGVRKSDFATGRASMLLQSDGLRTLGTKLNYATTLWDYIFRAMPWTNSQSLTVDETYAVTAYVLHLNEIVPADYELNEKTLLSVQMPNRNGLTTAHGLGSVHGRPDAQGSRCMKDCIKDVRITSEIPEFARNQNGNLAQQKRPFGPMRGIDTARFDAGKTATTQVATQTAVPHPSDLIARHACTACHGLTNKIVGPGFNEIATRYQGRTDALAYLSKRIKEGGQGVWGEIPMPPQAGLKESDAEEIARWIASGAK
ncbi:MAG TPA: c-type cytochrome [Burkholderiaceae bacterium]|nr:c-type cytochrome [Burkholderiaceae bacterium]